MAKNCSDCILKHEKTKTRQRNAKKRQKQKQQLAAPAPVIRQIVLPPAQPYIPPTQPFKLPAQTQNDLTFFQRAQELDTLAKLLDKKQQRLDKESDDYYKRVAKANPQFLTPQGVPPAEPTPLPTLERTRKPAPKTANEAVSQVVDNYVGLLTSGIPSSVLSQTPAALAAPAIVAGQYARGLLSTPFQFLGGVASSIGRAAAAAAEPEPEVRRSLQRTAPAVGGTTPELQFIGATGRVLESSPVEQGGNPLPSVFTASAPPVNLLADLQARERAERLRPRTRVIPEEEIGGEGGSRRIEQRRRIDAPYELAPKEYQAIAHNRVETSPPLPIFPVGQPPVLLPETETANALGERTVLDLALRPRVDFPLVPVAAGLIPETESFAPLVEQIEEPLLDVPQTFETAASLATGEPLEEEPLTSEGLAVSPRALERQTTEELAAAIEDVDTEELRAAAEKQSAIDEEKRRRKEDEKFQKTLAQIAKIEDRAKREEAKAKVEAEKEAKRLERDRARAEKELKKQTPKPPAGIRRRDVANTPRLETFFRPRDEELQYGRLTIAAASVPSSQLAAAELEAEEPEPITFTQPAERTFRFAEGGGV